MLILGVPPIHVEDVPTHVLFGVIRSARPHNPALDAFLQAHAYSDDDRPLVIEHKGGAVQTMREQILMGAAL